MIYGKALLAKDRDDEATEELKKALALNVDLDEVWYLLGVLSQKYRDYRQAFEHYEKALSLKPLEVSYILAVADVYTATGDYTGTRCCRLE